MGKMYFPGDSRYSSPTYSQRSSSNNNDNWKLRSGFVTAIIVAILYFCGAFDNSSLDSSSTDDEIIDSVEHSEIAPSNIETVETENENAGQNTETQVDFSSLKETIRKWNSLRIASITDTGEGAAFYGNNGFACHHAPDGLYDKLNYINKNRYHIDDFNIIDNNSYVVIYGDYGYSVKGAPQAFINKLHEYNSDREKILSASFNSNGDWVIITKKHYSWSNSEIRDFCNYAQENYGNIKYMFISDYGKVACCSEGIYYDNIPSNVETAINEFEYTPHIIKFTDKGKYCIATNNGGSSFNF